MYFAETIMRPEYDVALASARRVRADLMWGVDDPPSGAYLYHLLKHDAYCAIHRVSSSELELCSVFRDPRGDYVPGVVAAALSITSVYNHCDVILNCFEQAAPAYLAAGFKVEREFMFDDEQAPPLWTPEYGRPSVLFMRYQQ